MLLLTIADPNRLAEMTADELVAHAADHGRWMLRLKAALGLPLRLAGLITGPQV